MLLSALRAYAETNKELSDYHARQPVRYRIDLDANGDVISTSVVSDPGRPNRGMTYVIPYATRTTKTFPLPVDRADYVLGIAPPTHTDTEAQRTGVRSAARHEAYVSLLADAATKTGLSSFQAMHRFASTVDTETLDLPEDFDPTRFVAVYVEGALPIDDPRAQRWWSDRQAPPGDPAAASPATDPPPRVCGTCGIAATPVPNMKVQIRGLDRVGGSALTALISGNAEVFERHGMCRATGASICAACANSTHQTLNQLIADENHTTVLGASMYVSWSTEETTDLIGAIVSGETESTIGAALESLLTGTIQPAVDTSRFYCVTLGANRSRVIVRNWTDVALADVLLNIRTWFGRIRVVDRDGAFGPYPGICKMLATIAPPGKGKPLSRLNPGLPDTVLIAALTGAALPPALLAKTLARVRAQLGHIPPATAALIKACLTTANHARPEDHMAALNLSASDPAYLCGRLLAILDDAARLATSPNNSLVDRSYSAASTMPAVTLSRLLRLHQAHLAKLRRDSRGVAVGINTTVTDILNGLDDLPRTFGVTEQGRFALGLYHQQAANRAAARKTKEGKSVQQNDSEPGLDTQENDQ